MRQLAMRCAVVGSALALLGATTAQAATQELAGAPGSVLYKARCASCHDAAVERVPPRSVLEKLSADDIIQSMTSGVMAAQTVGLTASDINNIAAFVSTEPVGVAHAVKAETNLCGPSAPLRLAGLAWNGWGRDLGNSRFQPQPGFTAADVPRLKVKWAFGYRAGSVYGQPSVVGGRIFVTSYTGRIYSLDAKTGCTHWTFDIGASSRTAISVGETAGPGSRLAAFFGDDKAVVYALDAQRGTLLWKVKLDDNPNARITGAPTLYQNRLYVPVAALEEVAAASPAYECCKFRGSVVALDTATGKTIWQSFMILDAPKPYAKSTSGGKRYGPAGASVWSAPTIDVRRRLIYVTTGNSFTDIDAPAVDAVVALDLASGAQRWVRRLVPMDNFVVGCITGKASDCPAGALCTKPGENNCPSHPGADVDFGSSAVLQSVGADKDVILAGQKSGQVYALDPERGGALLWERRTGEGSPLGGVEWGLASDERNVYAPNSDVFAKPGHVPGGLTAIDIASGKVVWYAPPLPPVCSWGGDSSCTAAQSQAVTAMPGIVFSGSQDGHLRAYSNRDGSIVWDFDTARTFTTANAVAAHGGSLDHGGATIVDGVLYLNAGYGRLRGHPGNVLLALTPDGR
jgi:polyvinyl alcohol dehydrogenase (cytochrome)